MYIISSNVQLIKKSENSQLFYFQCISSIACICRPSTPTKATQNYWTSCNTAKRAVSPWLLCSAKTNFRPEKFALGRSSPVWTKMCQSTLLWTNWLLCCHLLAKTESCSSRFRPHSTLTTYICFYHFSSITTFFALLLLLLENIVYLHFIEDH